MIRTARRSPARTRDTPGSIARSGERGWSRWRHTRVMPRRFVLVLTAPTLPLVARGDGEPVLHEYVPEDPSRRGDVIGAGEDGANPAAIRVGGEVLPEPDAPAEPEPGEPTYGADDATLQRRHE